MNIFYCQIFGPNSKIEPIFKIWKKLLIFQKITNMTCDKFSNVNEGEMDINFTKNYEYSYIISDDPIHIFEIEILITCHIHNFFF